MNHPTFLPFIFRHSIFKELSALEICPPGNFISPSRTSDIVTRARSTRERRAMCGIKHPAKCREDRKRVEKGMNP